MKEYLNYNDPLTIASVFEAVNNKKQIANDHIKQINEASKDKINNKNKINIKKIIFISSTGGDLCESETKFFKDAIKKYNNIEITYIFNFFTYFLEDDELTITYYDQDQKDMNSCIINMNENFQTLFMYKSIHPDMWNEYLYKFSELLEKNFFLQINPPHLSRIANDKFLSTELLDKYHIQQPKYCLIEKIEIDMHRNEDPKKFGANNILLNKLSKIYDIKAEKFSDIFDYEYVIKTLNGSHGIGVMVCTGKQILGILQTLYYLDPTLKLLVQAKEKTIDGDLRVHVLTLASGQYIVAKMKRKKIGGDFRSNYSLGADIEDVELTQEQIQLAFNVAKVSGLTWCAVDIMPIKENEQGYENVIIEYNQNPGVEGISKILHKNFFNVLLDLLFKHLSKDDFTKTNNITYIL